MSASEFDRQLLLSAALDGVLDDAERALFERELQTDPTFALQWQELQSLQGELKQSLQELKRERPPVDLASRIVASAFANDPKSAVSSSPAQSAGKTLAASGRRVWTARIAGALALAASLMMMVTWLTNFDTDSPSPSPQQLANSGASVGAPNLGAVRSVGEAGIEPSITDDTATPAEMLAPLDQVAKNADITPTPSTTEMKQTVPEAAVAQTEIDDAAVKNRTPLKVLLVFSVQVTDKGREELALQSALRSAGIRLGADSVVSDQVVSQLRKSNVVTTGDAATKGAKLFFIEGSAKKIDQLLTQMVNQPDMFASVGMTLTQDPPLLASVTSLPVDDPTRVKSAFAESVALGMVSSDSQPLAVAESYSFMAVDRTMMQMGVAGMGADPSQKDRDDFTSQLLLIVR